MNDCHYSHTKNCYEKSQAWLKPSNLSLLSFSLSSLSISLLIDNGYIKKFQSNATIKGYNLIKMCA